MKSIINQLKAVLILTLVGFNIASLSAQNPCDGTECCIDNQGFEEFMEGPLTTTQPFQTPGYYAIGNPVTIVEDGCMDPQSVELITGTGGVLAYYAGGGFAGDNPVLEEGKTYCITFCAKVANDAGSATVSITTESQTVYTSAALTFNDGWTTFNIPNYVSTDTDFTMVVGVNSATVEVPVRIDNICIEEKMSGESCMADFDYELLECGEVCLTNRSCGESPFYVWDIYDASNNNIGPFNSTDLCTITLPSGNNRVVLTVFGADGCSDISEENIFIEGETLTLDCDNFQSILIPSDEECFVNWNLGGTVITGGQGSVFVDIFVDNVLQAPGTTNVPLTAGAHVVRYEVVDDCTELSCSYEILIECEMDDRSPLCGQAMITCFPGLAVGGFNTSGPVVGRVDVRDRSAATTGYWAAQSGSNIYHPAHWNATNLGLPFGIAIDNADNVYVTASTAYGCPGGVNVFGPGGASGIYKIDPSDNITNFVTTGAFDLSGTGTTIPNMGGALGNICYSKVHDLLYVTNLSTGKIYTINTSGQVIGEFDPFGSTTISQFAPLGDRPWGIGYNALDNRLYFGNWVENYLNENSTRNNEIWSVSLDAAGMITGTEQLEWSNPAANILYTSPISDIAFSEQGRMLVSEKTMGADCGGSFVRSTAWAHKSRVWELEYNLTSSSWQPTSGHNAPYTLPTDYKFQIGIPTGNTANSAGGIDYGYNNMSTNSPLLCDEMVWTSADIMQDCNLPTGGGNRWYGIQGTPSTGGSNCDSYLVDFNGFPGYGDKYAQGDVEIFKCGCDGQTMDCDSLMVMSERIPTMCVDPSIIQGVNCITVFDPVCGCDGVTYSNGCFAVESGVTTFVPGECNSNNIPTPDELCCYSIDLKNNYGSSIVELEVEMLTSEWIFNTTSLAAPFTFGSCGSLNNKFCVRDAGSGFIPSGISMDAISTCFAPTVSNPTTQPQVEFRWREKIGEVDTLIACRDTLDFFCELPPPIDTCLVVESDTIRCIEGDNPLLYEYCFTLTNKSGQPVDKIVLDDLPPGFVFTSPATASRIVFSTPTPLPDNTTSALICVEVESYIPITQPGSFCLNMGLIAEDGSDCCHSPVEVCTPIEPCCSPCDDKSVSQTSIDGTDEECCYSVSITNECKMPYFVKIEAEVNTPGVCFGSHVMGAAHVADWTVVSDPRKICMTPVGNIIDKSSYQDLFSYCLDKIDDPSQANPSITIRWYAADPLTGEPMVVCEDILETNCEASDNECVIVSNGDIVCIPDSNKYRYTFQIKNVSSPGFTADRLFLEIKNDLNWQPVPTGPVIPLVPALAPGDSMMISTCIQGNTFPATFPDFVFGYRLQNLADGDCCFESTCDTIPVPPCTDCCDEDRLNDEFDDYLATLLVDDCKVSFGPIELDSCVSMSINWGDGTGDAYHLDSLSCKTYDQPGVYTACIQWEVYENMGTVPCYFREECIDIEISGCDTDCFSIVNIEAKEVTCDTVDCYESPFCQPWLINEINNIFCGTSFLPYVDKAMYNSTPVFVFTYPNIEGATVNIYDCGGTLLQSCTPTGGGGVSCNPDAGIDLLADLFSVQRIWNCGDSVPGLSSSCATSMSVEYCVTLINQNPNDANQVVLNPIVPVGSLVMPSIITGSIPSGTTSTLTFTVSGPLVPGVDNKVLVNLLGLDANDQEWMCNDTICLPTPNCPPPPMDDCCDMTTPDDIDASLSATLNNVVLNQCGACLDITVGDCVEWTLDWGDGSISGPSNGSSQECHTYAVSGPYTISLTGRVYDDNGDLCHEVTVQETVDVDCPPMDDCCDMTTSDDIDGSLSATLNNVVINQCGACLDITVGDCVEWTLDWGDGSISGPSNGSSQECHTYAISGPYTISLTGRVYDDNGDLCHEVTVQETVDVDCPPMDDCCDDYDLMDLDASIIQALNNATLDQCNYCVEGEFPDCVNWYVDWGDGSSAIGTSVGNDMRCYDYTSSGSYIACLYAFVIDTAGDTCLMSDQCISVMPDCPSDCCDVSDDEYDDFLIDILDYDREGCDTLCFYPDGEDCDMIIIDFGDGTVVGPQVADDDICHTYPTDGSYTVCIDIFRLDDDDPTIYCIERDTCFMIDVDCDISTDCCDDYTAMDLDDDIDIVLNSLDEMGCSACLEGELPDCVDWTLDWGDGSTSTSMGAVDDCHSYSVSGDLMIVLIGNVFDTAGDLCFTVMDSVTINLTCGPIPPPICDPNTWVIPNGLSPNGDLLNEELKFSNTDDCTIDLKVYNRWGQMVFNQKDYTTEWHGQSNNGEALPDGTYYLLIGTSRDRDGNIDNYITRFVDLRRE